MRSYLRDHALSATIRFILVVSITLLNLSRQSVRVAAQGIPETIDASASNPAAAVILIQFRQTPGQFQLAQLAADLGGEVTAEIPQIGWSVLRVPAGQEQAALKRAWNHPAVISAGLDVLVRVIDPPGTVDLQVESTYCHPDDADFEGQWALNLLGAPAFWQTGSGAGLIVGVLDSGIQLNHPDLFTQIWTNQAEIAANFIDDDSNGKIDDIHGWHFYNSGLQNANVSDDFGHGTHVSGIIAAANNGSGTSGVAPASQIMPVKVLDQYGQGHASDIAAGIIYAVDNGAQIINLSIGTSEDIPILKNAIEYADSQGAIIVAAAGNDGTNSVDYPAKYPQVLAVAASDSCDLRASFSDYGAEIEITAPGVRICSTGYCAPTRDCSNPNFYFYKSGTSMASPHVAGVAALIWSAEPALSAAEVRARLANAALDLAAPGWDIYTGWGRVNLTGTRQRCHNCFLPIIIR